MRELIYLTNVNQLKLIVDEDHNCITNKLPITGDLTVSYELEKMGVEFINEWDNITPLEIEHNFELASTLSESWWQELGLEEYSELFQFTSADMYYPINACLNASTVYDRILFKHKVTKISGYFSPEIGIMSNGPAPVSQAVQSIVEAVLFWKSQTLGIKIEKLPWLVSKNKKANRLFERSIISSKSSGSYHNREFKRAIIVKDLMDQKEVYLLCKILDESSEWGYTILDKKDLEFHPLFSQDQPQLSKRLDSFLLSMVENQPNANINLQLFSNPFLYFQFERLRDELFDTAKYGKAFLSIIEVIDPSLIIFGHDAFTRHSHLVNIARENNIVTASLVHGGFGYKIGGNFVTGKCDHVFVWNDYRKTVLVEEFHGNSEQLLTLGCLKLENEFFQYLSGKPPILQTTKIIDKAPVPKHNSVVLIVTAAIHNGFASPLASPSKHIDAFQKLISLINKRQDILFILKPHNAYDYYDFYLSINNSMGNNFIYDETSTLNELLELSDICIMINYFTTAALEAMLQRIPVIYVDNAVYKLSLWEPLVPEFKLNRLKSINNLEIHIDKLLLDMQFMKATLLEADNIIKSTFNYPGLSARDRFKSYLETIEVSDRIHTSKYEQMWAEIIELQNSDMQSNGMINHIREKYNLTVSSSSAIFALWFSAGYYDIDSKIIKAQISLMRKSDNSESGINFIDIFNRGYILGLKSRYSIGNGYHVKFIIIYALQYFKYFKSIIRKDKDYIFRFIIFSMLSLNEMTKRSGIWFIKIARNYRRWF
jgi:hypothetical protein